MAVTLQKGQNISLSKTDPSLHRVLIGLGGMHAAAMAMILIWMHVCFWCKKIKKCRMTIILFSTINWFHLVALCSTRATI